MAKDDYFVIVYKMLKYLYDCLKSDITPDFEILSAERLEIPENYWNYIMINMCNMGLVTGVEEIPVLNGVTFKNMGIMITPAGIEYLFDNSMIAKVKNALKDVKSIVPRF